MLERYFERHPEARGTRLERRAHAALDLVLARGHRDAYLAHLAQASARSPAVALRELGSFAGLVARRALRKALRRRPPAGADEIPAPEVPAPRMEARR